MSTKITYKIFDNINEVPYKIWDEIADKSSLIYSSKYWKLIESSKITGFYNYNFIIFFIGLKPIAIASCYMFDVDLCSCVNPIFKKIIQALRRFFPKFMITANLECGTPINIHSPPFVIDPEVAESDILYCLEGALKKTAKRYQTSFISIKDINSSFINNEKCRAHFNKNKYSIISSTPNSYINIKWSSISEYLADMKSYYRSKLNNHLRKNKERNISCKLVNDFSELSNDLYKQWLIVYSNTKGVKSEVLNSDFYHNFSDDFDDNSKVLLFYSDKKLIGHALLLTDNHILRWLYIGREKSQNDSLYIYIMYKVIETAINLGIKKIDCGPTTYSVKQDLGAEIKPLYYAIKFNCPVINFCAKYFLRKLNNNNIPKNKNIFKNMNHEYL
ncbi:MAG: GNAT family N-acetyltransferase [bacterium]|nr:GNAT family N-acetyltransferase [bacterium]